MRRDTKMFGQIAALIGLVAADAALADPLVIDISQAVHKEGVNDGVGVTRIDVSGAEQYDEVLTKTLEFWVLVKDRKPANAVRYRRLTLRAADIIREFPGAATGTRAYRLEAPYSDPRGAGTDLPYSPIAVCNAELARRNGAERDAFLKEGEQVRADRAYPIDATAVWELIPGGVGFRENYTREFKANDRADAIIHCRALAGPKVRTTVQTTGATPRTGQRLDPALEIASFKVEPYQSEIIGKQTCPSRLRLYGYVKVRRAFSGKLVFFGPAFLSPITGLRFVAAGQRTIVGDYPVKWGSADAKATPGLMAQTVSLKMNVTDADNKVLETVTRDMPLSCKPTRVPAATRAIPEALVASGSGIDTAMSANKPLADE